MSTYDDQQDCPAWPEAFAERYRQAGYWREETFGDVLREAARAFAEREALSAGEQRLSYRQLDLRVDQLASGLYRLGLRAGDNVVLQLPNSAAFVEVCFALYRLGVRPIFALPAHRQLEIGRFCEFAQARAYLCADQDAGFDYRAMARELKASNPHLEWVIVAGEAEEFTALCGLYDANPTLVLPSPSPEAVACFQLSGGSTGIPKLIPRRHQEYVYNLRASVERCGFTSASVYLVVLPMAHNFPMCCPGFIGALSVGGRVVLSTSPSPEVCFELIEREAVTHTALVPPLALVWLEAAQARGRGVPQLQLLQVGGARLSFEAARRVEPVLGCRLQQVFGMAEGLICYTDPQDPPQRVLHTQGRPLSPADEIRVVDEQDQPVEAGQVGQLLTRGPYTIRGYYRYPEHNAQAFTAEGFYRTGDRVLLTADGYLVVEGRDKDLINRGGEKIAAEEVENLLLSHPAVADVALVAMPDAFLGERTCAFVIPRGPAPRAPALLRHLRSQGLAAFKLPDRFEFIPAFPQTGVGKVSRKHLREAIQALYFGDRAELPEGSASRG
ncbi:(2,3-dihydroxybenzoyl)adenylate synthase [Pseudomonas sessilinigenes]|uniref:AMP-binding protein n=1 Tax=Pseudomonas sessilinigenes TaxID=658629 RepID=A0ABX8MJR6_9PSED|nr:AMP-binding protein [Pseudomonas sessilinigenes]AZC27131.1 2,3-dihydroxybenzoate-AMP ligase of siderophore biosynthesis [Pseudomonas sessilinigenes]QXH38927.1 AMP-binding protein [Pseudomonas sessilinigenes]